MDDLSTRLASSLKRLREARDLSQKALAELSGVPRPTIAHLESGQANPTLSVVLRVARSLGVTMEELVEPGKAPIRILTSKTLPTERTSRLRRVQLLAPGALSHAEVERISMKAGGRIRLEPPAGGEEIIACERGTFSLVSGAVEVELSPEHVAVVVEPADCVAREGGLIYRVAGR